MKPLEKEIRKKLDDLALVEFCYPIDIFSISNIIAEQLYPDDARKADKGEEQVYWSKRT